MSIRFHCQRCNQLLGIASRKAGSPIDCPKCGFNQTVPTEEAAAAALAMSQFSRTTAAADSPNDLVVYDDEPAAIETPQIDTNREAQQATVPDTSNAAIAVAEFTGAPVPPGMILFARSVYYWQGLLAVLLAAAMFTAGYFIGQGRGSVQSAQQAEAANQERIIIEGRLTYDTGLNEFRGDEGAMVIVLPEDGFPAEKLPVADFRPGANPAEDDRTIRSLQEFGGACARADSEGDFTLVVPGSGDYRMLIISAHTKRPKKSDVEEVDLMALADFFILPEHLIGSQKYQMTRETIGVGFDPIEINFGRDREAGLN